MTTVEQLSRQIDEFRSIDLRAKSYAEIQEEIYRAFSINGLNLFTPFINTIPAGTRFYRVRVLAEDDRRPPFKGMNVWSDVWNPPAQYVTKLGRLNKIGESLLYVTPIRCDIPITELKIQQESMFSMIVYEAREQINVSQIGLYSDTSVYSPEENIKLRLISNFLFDEFSRTVNQGDECRYAVSEIIAKSFYDLPPREIQDAWCYPSIAYGSQHGAVNVCFRPEIALDVLKFVGVGICKYARVDSAIELKIIGAAQYFDNNSKLIFHLNPHRVVDDVFGAVGMKLEASA